jgi:hypothetical protein
MKRLNRLPLGSFLTIVLWAGLAAVLPQNISAAEQNGTQQTSASAERTFGSSDEAIQALKTAGEAKDKSAMREIFGSDFDQLSTGDKAQDAKNAEKFATALAQGCKPVPEGEDKITLEVGTNAWPMPIPLVKENGQWHFDTAAGKEEIIARHVGKDELHAIGVCRAYVKAQQQYSSADAGPNGSYAQKFKSTPGKKDGLDCAAPDGQAGSLLVSGVAEAQTVNNTSGGPQPFHGYYFRILTRQGEAAPGGTKNYMSQGMLAGGFALVAYPARWDQSGIMTFIVNQDGNVYERNLGEKTSQVAQRMKAYNPDSDWKSVQDEGTMTAAAEK